MLKTKQKRIQAHKQPSIDQLKTELKRIHYRKRYGSVLRSTVYTLLISAACAILVATIFLPVLQIYGTSMAPTLDEGEIVVSVKGMDFTAGDLISFYVGNKLLIKRYIAGPGQWVNIDAAGNEFTYEVVSMETISGTDVDGLTAGEWDLTLFTCTVDGASRVAARCERLDNE